MHWYCAGPLATALVFHLSPVLAGRHFFLPASKNYDKNRNATCYYDVYRISMYYDVCRNNGAKATFTLVHQVAATEKVKLKTESMAKKHTLKPTEAELEVLQVLWKIGPGTVRQVHEALNPGGEGPVYTTTLKILQNMYEKGLADRHEAGRKHIYKAVASEEDIQQKLLDRFLNTAFGGSAMKLVMQALGNHKATREEIEEIRKLLNKKEGGEK